MTPSSEQHSERCARDSGWCDGVACSDRGVDCPRSDHVLAVTRIAESRGCIGPYPCGRAIPEFGGRDAACDCEQIAQKTRS